MKFPLLTTIKLLVCFCALGVPLFWVTQPRNLLTQDNEQSLQELSSKELVWVLVESTGQMKELLVEGGKESFSLVLDREGRWAEGEVQVSTLEDIKIHLQWVDSSLRQAVLFELTPENGNTVSHTFWGTGTLLIEGRHVMEGRR